MSSLLLHYMGSAGSLRFFYVVCFFCWILLVSIWLTHTERFFTFHKLINSNPMEPKGSNSDGVESAGEQKFWYSVWGLPPDDVTQRVKKLMSGLRSEYGGPDFEPHVTVVGSIFLTESDAIKMFRSAVDGLKAYPVTVERISTGTFYYQCVFLLLHPSAEVVETSSHCCHHFGYKQSSPYMPHISLLYADLSEEEKKAAQEKANALDDSISGLSFPITQLALYKTDTEDKSTKSWRKIIDCNLIAS